MTITCHSFRCQNDITHSHTPTPSISPSLSLCHTHTQTHKHTHTHKTFNVIRYGVFLAILLYAAFLSPGDPQETQQHVMK